MIGNKNIVFKSKISVHVGKYNPASPNVFLNHTHEYTCEINSDQQIRYDIHSHTKFKQSPTKRYIR